MGLLAWERLFRKDVHNQQFDKHTTKFLDQFISLLQKGAKVLDVGCGDGRKAIYLLKRGFDVQGIDSSKTAIAHARKSASERFKLGNVTHMPYPDSSFDGVLSIAVYHCLSESDRKKFVHEAFRVLKKGGILYQLVLSSKDETIIKKKTSEKGTFLQPSGVKLHLFTKAELKDDFADFKFLKLVHMQRDMPEGINSIFLMTITKQN